MSDTSYVDGVNKLAAPLRLYVAVRQYFQPYYRNWSWLATPKKKPKPAKTAPAKSTSTSRPVVDTANEASDVGVSSSETKVAILRYSKPLDNAIRFKKKPPRGSLYTYHDATKHQVFAHFGPGDGFAYSGRSDVARKKLTPLVYPKQAVPFDRTHLIPIGYHGSEKDSRLLVGWDSATNRGLFADFEKKQKKRTKPIYWLTSVTKNASGALWEYKIYDVDSGELVDSVEHQLNAEFIWK